MRWIYRTTIGLRVVVARSSNDRTLPRRLLLPSIGSALMWLQRLWTLLRLRTLSRLSVRSRAHQKPE
jgi:hypothetical protein